MAKTPKTYSAFDVATDNVLKLISAWRADTLAENVSTKLNGSLLGCQGALTAANVGSWRDGRALAAELLTVCSHGANASVNGCDDTRLYITGEVGDYPELPGAIVHFLACDSLSELGQVVCDKGGALAVIGYDQEVSVAVPAGSEIDNNTKELPPSIQPSIDFDSQILVGLANGLTVGDAVAGAQAWANDRITQLSNQIDAHGGPESSDPMVPELLSARSNLDLNRNALGTRGDNTVSVTL